MPGALPMRSSHKTDLSWKPPDRGSGCQMEETPQLIYRAYILRLWQERPASPERRAVWRFSLEDTRARQRRGFGDLAELTAFLEAQIEAEQQGSTGTGE